ncbi:MAG: metalloregulator ArsR/SmtB family transcription factor [Desulfovibrio sp.]|nr:metalloregulator ArsR/SmtB family transcription factor [Desulfovibrio sp.]MCA1984899.1 metalloregulator ArsR/SmtB family transcription factor [Desulfovibrio sp.]
MDDLAIRAAAACAALGDATRLRLALLLRAGELCVCDVQAVLGLPQSSTSRQLAVLRQAGVVESRRDGKWMHYRLSLMEDPTLGPLAAWLDTLGQASPQALEDAARLSLLQARRRGCCEVQTPFAGIIFHDARRPDMRNANVLFICEHNSARSQMAEAYVELLSDGEITAASAGFDPRPINPLVVEVMREDGVDLSQKQPQSVFEVFKSGAVFQAVITVCDEAAAGACPVFPGLTHRLHLPFPDPAALEGSPEEKLAKTREIRDQIKAMARDFIAWYRAPKDKKLGASWEWVDIKGKAQDA